jgi:hypothetical protein
MRIEIIYGHALENGAKPVSCIDCRTDEHRTTEAVAVLAFGQKRIPLCLQHLTFVERNVAAQVERLVSRRPTMA